MCFIYIYHSEHYGLSFLDLTDARIVHCKGEMQNKQYLKGIGKHQMETTDDI